MDIDVDAVLALDDQRKALQLEIDQTKAQQKQLAAQKDYE
jgi:seryl-tRNA synthetase